MYKQSCAYRPIANDLSIPVHLHLKDEVKHTFRISPYKCSNFFYSRVAPPKDTVLEEN